jgi:hypothetical protein
MYAPLAVIGAHGAHVLPKHKVRNLGCESSQRLCSSLSVSATSTSKDNIQATDCGNKMLRSHPEILCIQAMSKYDQNNHRPQVAATPTFLSKAENMTASKPFGPQKYDLLKEQKPDVLQHHGNRVVR